MTERDYRKRFDSKRMWILYSMLFIMGFGEEIVRETTMRKLLRNPEVRKTLLVLLFAGILILIAFLLLLYAVIKA